MIFSNDELERFKQWKYTSKSFSVIDKYLEPYWIQLSNHIPSYVSANLLTITGHAIIHLINCLSTFGNNWFTSFIIGIGILVYYTIDCLDGKQARKLKNSTCFGELIDHVFDLYTIFTLIEIVGRWSNCPNDTKVFSYLFFGIVFMQTHFDAVKSKTIKFNNFIGPTEVVLFAALLFFTNVFLDLMPFFASDAFSKLITISFVLAISYHFIYAEDFFYLTIISMFILRGTIHKITIEVIIVFHIYYLIQIIVVKMISNINYRNKYFYLSLLLPQYLTVIILIGMIFVTLFQIMKAEEVGIKVFKTIGIRNFDKYDTLQKNKLINYAKERNYRIIVDPVFVKIDTEIYLTVHQIPNNMCNVFLTIDNDCIKISEV